MENYPYSSYPNSGNSSPRSREVDCETASFDEPNSTAAFPSNYKVKFMCSFGGKILPRPHDNQLTYVGGDTKILAVDRNVRFSSLLQKLNSISDSEICFKYQLPGEDLDALISVTNDEDLEHMMLEYDRLYRASVKPARLRLFLFPVTGPASFGLNETKSERQWFVDALNSVQIQNTEASSPASATASVENPDFLFGFDKGGHAPPVKVEDPAPAPEVFQKEIRAGSECGSEDRHVIGEPVVSPAEIHRQMQEFQRLQLASQEQAMIQRKTDEMNSRAYYGDYYTQKIPSAQPSAPMTGTVQPQYWQEQHMTTTGYSMAPGSEPPVYLISTPAGVYQAPGMRPPTGQVGQAYYGMQRMVPEVYREQPVYNPIAPPSVQQPKIGAYAEPIGQVSYEGAGRQMYYTTAGGVVPAPYQAMTTGATEMRQGGGGAVALNQDGKIVGNVKVQTSSM